MTYLICIIHINACICKICGNVNGGYVYMHIYVLLYDLLDLFQLFLCY